MALRKIHIHTKDGSEHIIRLKTDKCFDEFQSRIDKGVDFEVRCENQRVDIKTSEVVKYEVEVLPEAKKSCLTRIEEILDAVTRIDYRNKNS